MIGLDDALLLLGVAAVMWFLTMIYVGLAGYLGGGYSV